MVLKYVDTNLLNNSIIYICGPPGMVKAMNSLMQEELKVSKDNIRIEEFTGY
jgi:glycine betaine catabolism B